MKALTLFIFVSICFPCFADDTNIILKTEWSEPVSLRNLETLHDHSIRGRLLIVAGNELVYGGPKTDNAAMTFIELENVSTACCENIEICFDSMQLHCALTDAQGKGIQKGGAMGWSGRGPLKPYWITLPYNSTVRLFVNRGSQSPLFIYQNGEPWNRWSISSGDTNSYFLSGTLAIQTRTNHLKSAFDDSWIKTLTFPRTKVPIPK